MKAIACASYRIRGLPFTTRSKAVFRGESEQNACADQACRPVSVVSSIIKKPPSPAVFTLNP